MQAIQKSQSGRFCKKGKLNSADQKSGKQCFLLDSGDIFQGTPISIFLAVNWNLN
jgi:2',3'-cyclic-nucleotide 2'-phosphodiesterase (5'-nucleotidase family)